MKIFQIFITSSVSFLMLSCGYTPPKSATAWIYSSYLDTNVPLMPLLSYRPFIKIGPYNLRHLNPLDPKKYETWGEPFFFLSDDVKIFFSPNDKQFRWENVKSEPLREMMFEEVDKTWIPIDERTRYFFSVISALDHVVHAYTESVGEWPLKDVKFRILVNPVVTRSYGRILSYQTEELRMKNNAAFISGLDAIFLFLTPDVNLTFSDLAGNPAVLAHEFGHAIYFRKLDPALRDKIEEINTQYPDSTISYVYRVIHELFADVSAFIGSSGGFPLLRDRSRNPLLFRQVLSTLLEEHRFSKEFSPYLLATLLYRVLLLTFMEANNFDNTPQKRGDFWKLVFKLLPPLTQFIVDKGKENLSLLTSTEKNVGMPKNSLELLGQVLVRIKDILASESPSMTTVFCREAKSHFDVSDKMGPNFQNSCPS